MLARHVARHYYANATSGAVVNADAETADLLLDLLKAIAGRIAIPTGNWMAADLCMVYSIQIILMTGESLIMGHGGFARFDPGLTAAYFDQAGRYAFGRQPDAAMWAVCRLADCFVKLVPKSTLRIVCTDFTAH